MTGGTARSSRRQSRETAFALLFEWSFKPEESLDELLALSAPDRGIEADEFARALCIRAMEHVAELDSLIETYSDNWKLSRISRVTLAILRLAFCELSLFDDIPTGATINEAVELGKTYTTEDEAAFINGILGAHARRGDAPA